ncbi:hypothetical protein BACCAP_04500 [Pseudoflavonifractor capillosus ATCC 29799]|uniref:Uncharacterized protein n=1 Tax=Pseudoflavonifractor capillosus ATCC 29799 TaxID=411467 RepID=A6P1X1_9FIRM|nr:hypothetical protein BACCAP_04500 [Pseudoflavonifractor capillosus ATCC 29799]
MTHINAGYYKIGTAFLFSGENNFIARFSKVSNKASSPTIYNKQEQLYLTYENCADCRFMLE